jgi:hypothetical protein
LLVRAALVLRAPSRHAAQFLQATGQSVAHALQLSEPEQAGTADCPIFEAHCARRGDIGERGGQNRRKLALEPRDLLLQ